MKNRHKKKNILFVTYGAGHVNMIIPIWKSLKKGNQYKLTLLGLTNAGKVLQESDISYYGFKDFMKETDAAALDWGKKLAADVDSSIVPYEESIAYLGLSYFEMVERLGEDEAASQYTKLGRQAFLPLTVMNRILDNLKPDLVVATSSPRAERAAIISAGKLNIPSLCLVDLFGLLEITWVGQPGYANKVCVMSDYVKEILMGAGRSPDEVEVTGNPGFDRLASPKLAQQAKVLRKKRGWHNKTVILWASQAEPPIHPVTGERGDPDLPRKIERELFDLIEQNKDWHLVVRRHPSDNAPISDKIDRVDISPQSEDLATLLKAVNIVVTIASTVGLEGALLGKPFLTMDMSLFSQDAPFAKMGLSKGISNLQDLGRGIKEIINGQWRSTVTLPPVGQATDKVIQVIDHLLQE